MVDLTEILLLPCSNMSPHCHEMGHPEASGSTDGAAGLETAAPDTGTPTPSPTPSGTPTPLLPPPEGIAEAAVEQGDNQNRIDVNPAPVLQNEAPDCLPIDHNLSHLLVCCFACATRNVDEMPEITKEFSFRCVRKEKI